MTKTMILCGLDSTKNQMPNKALEGDPSQRLCCVLAASFGS